MRHIRSRTAVLALVLVLASSLTLSVRPSYGQTEGATMTVLKGQVALLHPDGSAIQPAPSGTTVYPGDEIRTLSRSGALITFFVGTEIELGEDSVMLVERVSRTGDRIDVSLKQVFGTSLHRVQTLAETGSSYRVEVGGAVALVRGTVFAVGYYPPYRAFYVQEGAVDCDKQNLNRGGYWNSGTGCEGLQSYIGSSSDPWSIIAEGLGLAAAVRGHDQEDDDKEDDHASNSESESEDRSDDTQAQSATSSRNEPEQRDDEDEEEEDEKEHKNQDNPGHSKNEDNPGHSDKH
jgi:hypothetical protein